MAGITLRNLVNFHTIDRVIFTKLIFSLFRDPVESLLVVAFWLSLENLKFGKLLDKDLIGRSDAILNELAKEAVICLTCLHTKILPDPPIEIPFTAVKIRKVFNLKMIYENKYTLISGIKVSLTNVYAYVFTDILSRIFPMQASVLDFSLQIPGFPHPTFGPLTVIPWSSDYVIPSEDKWGWSTKIQAPLDDRTIFLTFSRGYPVTEREVINLFNGFYGNCVEELSMDEPDMMSSSSPLNNQRLFARMVVRDVETLDRILSASEDPVAKFRIKGKHVWARKFERRNGQV